MQQELEMSEFNKQYNVCSETRKSDLQNRLSKYTRKQPNEPFIQGQKYYVVDDKVPNCVNSFVCGQPFRKGQTSRRFNDVTNQLESFQVDKDKCFSSDAQYNTSIEKKQLDKLDDPKIWDEKGMFNKYETKIWDTKKYPYELNNDNPNAQIYYRNCPFYGCSSGTSALDISPMGGKKKKTKKRKQKFRRTRR